MEEGWFSTGTPGSAAASDMMVVIYLYGCVISCENETTTDSPGEGGEIHDEVSS